MTKKKGHDYEMDVQFKGISIGTDTARLGFAIDRDDSISLDDADAILSNSQLSAVIICDPNADKDAEGQMVMHGAGNRLDVVADVKGYRVSSKAFSAGLTFNKQEIDLAVLSTYANRKGKVLCTRVGDAVSNEDHGEECLGISGECA